MGIYLKIGSTDVSRFITENKYSISVSSVYDNGGEFVNIYGAKVREKTGYEVDISAELSDVDDTSAAALSVALSGEICSVSYSAPTEKTGDFQCSGFSLSLDRVYSGEKFWTAQVKLHAAFVPEDGMIALSFQDTKGKLVLINDFYEKIGYPHKEYNKIEDEEDDYYSEEDMKWDRLHKHGL